MSVPVSAKTYELPKPTYPGDGDEIDLHCYERFILPILSGPFTGIPDLREMEGTLDTPPYITCNEIGQSEIARALAPRGEQPAGRVHFGFSSWLNYNIIAVRNPERAIICDINKRSLKLYQLIQTILAQSNTREEFVERFKAALHVESRYYFGLPPDADFSVLCDLRSELQREGSWISSEAGFQKVKEMHRENRVLYLNLDILDQEGVFADIADWLKKNHLHLDTLYVSNIVEWLRGELQRIRYLANLNTIADPVRTLFIDASVASARREAEGPHLRLSRGVSLPPPRTRE